jgi:hypothetical protein
MVSYSSLLVAGGAVGLLALLLRWAFGTGTCLVARAPRAGPVGEYGLLVSVASPNSRQEAERIRARLAQAGLRCTVTATAEGPRVFVFERDAPRARAALA